MEVLKSETNKTNNTYIKFGNYGGIDIEIPKCTEGINRTGGWYNWGANNLYPNYLISLTNRSALHNAICNLKASMIGRNGFISADWSPEAIEFLNNKYNDCDLAEILEKISLDQVIFGGYCLNIIWNNERTKIAEIHYISIESVRVAVEEKNGVKQYFVCDDWKNYKKQGNEPVLYPGFSSKNNSKASQILMVKENRASNTVYPEPEYLPGIDLMELNALINEYHLSTVKNSFSPSMHINFCETPPDEQLEDIVRGMKKQYEGAKKAGNVVFTFCEDPAKKTTFEVIATNDSDTKFSTLIKWVFDSIFSAHNITDQSLFGIDGPGKLNDRKNLLEALIVFQNIYVKAKQRMLEKTFNKLGRLNGLREKIQIEKFDVDIQPDLPMNDLLVLLESALPPRQQVIVLQMKGFSRTQALNLVNSGTPAATPVAAPVQPVEIKPSPSVNKNE